MTWKEIEEEFLEKYELLSPVHGLKGFPIRFFKEKFKEIMEEMVGTKAVAWTSLEEKNMNSIDGFNLHRQEMLDKIDNFFKE